MKNVIIVAALVLQGLYICTRVFAQDFQVNEITDKIFIVSDPEGRENQLAIQSKKGLVVFNTFWSEKTAQIYKTEIAKAVNRDDFAYTINTVDRLDVFGGNACYNETIIIGHDSFLGKYRGKEEEVKAEIQGLIDMWRWKEGVSRERQATCEKGSNDAIDEERWMNTCKQRADDLEDSFSLVLPAVLYNDRMTLHLGDMTLTLIWFGKAGHYNGMSLAVIPELKTAIIPGFILHPQHLAPHPHDEFAELDVPRWIAVLEEVLEGQNPPEKVICGINEVWSRERAVTHLEYIRRLWESVRAAEAEGKDLREIQNQLSLDRDFAFVKEMQVYKDQGDDWVRPQHQTHVKLFFLQLKDLIASELLLERGFDSLQVSLAKVRELRENGSGIYFDEATINGIGYRLLNEGRIPDAIEVFKLNVEVFPQSANVYDSLGEAYMKAGNNELAKKNYKRSLELNPDNENARKILEQLQK